MPSLITKWKKGKPYLYWVRSAWVNGHSRIVEQLYLGPQQRVMEQIRAQFTSVPPPEVMPGLRTVQPREFGASALLYALAQELGLIDLINAHVPPAPPGRRTSLSVGHSLLLAAIKRAAWPQSKRAFAEWYQGTVLTRLVPALPDELRRQRFWDHMALFEPEHFAPLQRELLGRMHERCPLGTQFLVYDTTNYYTFIHTCNSRPSLPQRGKNKQKRADLRQVALALVVDAERGLPRYYRCDEGNVTDVVALSASLQEMVGHFLPQPVSPRLTLVLDKGHVSHDNFKALTAAQVSFLAAIPAGWVRPPYQVSLQAYQPLTLPDGRRIKV
jgi:transposase